MKEEIEIDEYVRVKGYIGTVENINHYRPPDMEYGIEIQHFSDLVFVGEKDIVKHL